jgi:hypothetical protein
MAITGGFRSAWSKAAINSKAGLLVRETNAAALAAPLVAEPLLLILRLIAWIGGLVFRNLCQTVHTRPG